MSCNHRIMARGSRCCCCCCCIVMACVCACMCVSLSVAAYAASSCLGIMRVLFIPAHTHAHALTPFAADRVQVRLPISSHYVALLLVWLCACLHRGLILSVCIDPSELHLLQVVCVVAVGGGHSIGTSQDFKTLVLELFLRFCTDINSPTAIVFKEPAERSEN